MVYKGATFAVPAIEDPRKTFKRLFSNLPNNGGGDTPGLEKARLQRKSVLDFVKDDYQQLNTHPGARDRQKIDQHLTAISKIEKRLGTPNVVAMSCSKPAEPER